MIARLNVGGPAGLVLDVADGLPRTEFESLVLHGDVGLGEADWLSLRGSGAARHRVRGLGRAVRTTADLRAQRNLSAALRAFDPHIVHTHTAKAGVLGRLSVDRSRQTKVIHTFHGHVLHGYFGRGITRSIVLAERVLARRSDVLVTVGSAVRDDLLAAGIGLPQQYRVIPPGVAPLATVPQAAARQDLGLPRDALVIAMVGRLARIKRPDRAVRAVAMVRAMGVDASLLVAGDGELRAEIEAACAAAGVPATFLGWTADVGAVLAAADVVLLTSDNEGMPVTLIEAALAGRPCVATDVGGVAEVVRDRRTGYVVPPESAALARALRDLLVDQELRQRLGTAAAVDARARFGLSRLVDAHAELYREILG